ncbi:R-phenyllactate dehydratase small subunit [Desulfosarcina alkanivorans]|uniref:R-phenyllactate dehydratase small subunit n=1 Tax=Desulfosarcina alkanivorans TaxID=571177 RepID=A0A5K7YQR5_9BACT|nr:2-hydroxyacyl-CoA dehydratase family protein [Desulfosarcina alkanivorans]BBO70643.1 R-phenyllactate dehydratase small subunit [Desulfosarcina alkanivorans]
MDAIQALRAIAADPKAYARKWRQKTGGKVVGTLCSYAPEELILAGSALAYRIVGGSGGISRADAHLQAYSCSLVRGALEDALDGQLDFLDGAVFPHTCDSIQRLSDIWRMNAKTGFHLDVVLPVKLDTASARQYMTTVMANARSELEALLDRPISDAGLRQAIDIYNGIRTTMQRLYTLRAERPEAISGSDVHTIVRASMVMDRRDFLDNLTRVVDRLGPSSDNPAARRIFLSGGVCNLPDVYSTIASAGGSVVGDDLCTGSRGLTGTIDTDKDPVAAIAERYARRAVCPAKHSGITSRGDELVRLARAHRADGVIFIFLKFCDPHAFDYPYLKSMLDDAGIPSLLVELEEQAISLGQLQTRCEAFMEML